MSDNATKPDVAADDALPARVETVAQTPGDFAFPDNTVVRSVTGFLPIVPINGIFDLTFACIGAYVQPDGSIRQQAAITSRSRLDFDAARRLRDALNEAIESLTPPPKDQVN